MERYVKIPTIYVYENSFQNNLKKITLNQRYKKSYYIHFFLLHSSSYKNYQSKVQINKNTYCNKRYDIPSSWTVMIYHTDAPIIEFLLLKKSDIAASPHSHNLQIFVIVETAYNVSQGTENKMTLYPGWCFIRVDLRLTFISDGILPVFF